MNDISEIFNYELQYIEIFKWTLDINYCYHEIRVIRILNKKLIVMVSEICSPWQLTVVVDIAKYLRHTHNRGCVFVWDIWDKASTRFELITVLSVPLPRSKVSKVRLTEFSLRSKLKLMYTLTFVWNFVAYKNSMKF